MYRQRMAGMWFAILLASCGGGGGGGDDEKDGDVPSQPLVLECNAKGSSLVEASWSFDFGGQDGFRLERLIDGKFAKIVDLPADTFKYVDTGLEPATSYVYRVRGMKNEILSVPSNEATVTTGQRAWTLAAEADTGPTARYSHSAVFQPDLRRMIVFGGVSASSLLSDVWALDLAASPPKWSTLEISGQGPSARAFHTAVYDASLKRMIVYGGYGIPSGELASAYLGEVWSLDLNSKSETYNTWTALTSGEPKGYHSAILDTVHNRMVVYGGMTKDLQTGSEIPLNSVCSFDLEKKTWTSLIPHDIEKPAWMDHSAIFDGPGKRMIVFGGNKDIGPSAMPVKDIRAFDLDLYGSGYKQWSSLPSAESASAKHTAILDEANRRMIVFGGYNSTEGDVAGVRCFDLKGNAWTSFPTFNTIMPRKFHSAVYTDKQQMLIFGGYNAPSDVWSLDI